MVLTPEEIIERIKNPLNEKLLTRAKEIYKQHILHVKGVGIDKFLEKVQNYENAEQLENRKKTTKPMTVPIFERELSTFEKIFSAQGFSRYYDIGGESEKQETEFKKYLSDDVGEGRSIIDWMSEVWLEYVNYDPNGVIMLELPETVNGSPKPYLTYRCVHDIHDYAFHGRKIEYIIFSETKLDSNNEEYTEYRVVDDAFDYIFIKKGDKITQVKDATLTNYWGYVPAIRLSTKKDAVSDAVTTYVWKAIGVADEYLTDSSIHSVLKKLHGYPIFWMRERGCRKCSGEGRFANPAQVGTFVTCTDCKGSGVSLKKDVSDGIVIPQLTQQGQVDSLPVAGYEQPDLDTLKEQREELDWLASQIHQAIWSENELASNGATTTETATGRMLDIQAIYDRLNMFSKNAETIERFITNSLGKIMYADSYNGCIINYGRRYFIRGDKEIEAIYKDAKAAELPVSLLSTYREELVYTKYVNDPVQLSRQLKLMQIEPFQDYTIDQVQRLGVSRTEIIMKIYFNEYISRYEREVRPITFSTVEEIQAKLKIYNEEKIKQLNDASSAIKTEDQSTGNGTGSTATSTF